MKGGSISFSSGEYAFLFTDIDDSTRRWESDAKSMSVALRLHDEAIRTAIDGWDGYVFTTAGDSFSAAFTNATSALGAALQARASMRDVAWGEIEPLRVRYALNFGFAEFRAQDFFGPSVIRCARMLEAAAPDEIVATSTFVAQLHDDEVARIVDLGERKLRDLRRAERVYRVERF